MTKRSRILGSIAIAAVFLNASPAWANHEGIGVYRTTMYSDSSRTTVVGSIEFSYCTYYAESDGVQYHLEGTYTSYQQDELVGWCSEGNFGPVHVDS
ncbi:MAG TPA: hypothetical protein VF574_11445 [Allosphingosinicella sp.]